MLLEATDRWNAVTAHHAVTEQLRSKIWETELQVRGFLGAHIAYGRAYVVGQTH